MNVIFKKEIFINACVPLLLKSIKAFSITL